MEGLARLIRDPVILVDRHGGLLDMNQPAAAMVGWLVPSPPGDLFQSIQGLRDLLRLASGTAEPVIGGLQVPTREGESNRFRARAVVNSRLEGQLTFAVQLLDTAQDKFSILSRRIEELNSEIVARRAAQARLEETLAHNTVLYQELQHRVKNHLQMMLGLFATARRETADLSTKGLIEKLELKLLTIFEAQQLMYRTDAPTGVDATDLLQAMARIFQLPAGETTRIVTRADPLDIPNDAVFPLALVICELVSNAITHGAPAGSGHVELSLQRIEGGYQLMVQDDGPGFVAPAGRRRSSGLGLVRGLCRQLGAELDIPRAEGGLAIVRFSGQT
ncbi:MAG TPA: sensor histidine kinase [Geminicoccus sp.]|jgi:two-component sensor histidine kinase|uniref:sensor histidine kinase n=1 Tax=Geminicoccus sp. TaxID=2024832 RepID=UPI002E35267D|nr:sensor histidine kinase [Geminicoccus sp.]HEX2529697.1 sensor histidine kinase [Geminicoccus sp.]